MMKTAAADRSMYRWMAISVAFANFMARLDTYIVNISLPTISRYFNVTTGEVSRVILIYLLVSTSTLLLFGKLGDRFGLKRVFILGYIFFTAGSLFCGISPSLHALVLSRFVQGLGCAMLVATSFAIIPKFLPHSIVGWAFGISSIGAGLGIAVGAPLGGIITGYLSWQWIFLINVPLGIIAIFIANRVIPPEKGHPKTRGGFDIAGSLMSFAGLSLLLYALNTGHEAGWGSLKIVSLLVATLIIFATFVIWETRCSLPLIDFSLFKNPRFTYANISAFFAFMFLAGNTFLLPFYLIIGKKLDTVHAGFLLMIYSMVVMVVGPLAGRLSDRIRPSLVCTIGMFSAAACSFAFSLTLGADGLVPVLVLLFWLPLSYAMFISPNNNQVMTLAPADKHGIASGVFNTVNTLGLALGVCVFETVMSASMPHHGTSLGKYLAGKSVLPPQFFEGFRNAYTLGGIICLIALVFSAMIRLRPGPR